MRFLFHSLELRLSIQEFSVAYITKERGQDKRERVGAQRKAITNCEVFPNNYVVDYIYSFLRMPR